MCPSIESCSQHHACSTQTNVNNKMGCIMAISGTWWQVHIQFIFVPPFSPPTRCQRKQYDSPHTACWLVRSHGGSVCSYCHSSRQQNMVGFGSLECPSKEFQSGAPKLGVNSKTPQCGRYSVPRRWGQAVIEMPLERILSDGSLPTAPGKDGATSCYCTSTCQSTSSLQQSQMYR